MDANDTLRRMREAASNWLAADASNPRARNAWARDLVRDFAALDSHLSAGGTPPEEWREGPDAVGEEPAVATWQGVSYDETHRELHRRAAFLADESSPRCGRCIAGEPLDPADPLGPPNPAGAELPGIVSVETDATGNYVVGIREERLAWKPNMRPGVL